MHARSTWRKAIIGLCSAFFVAFAVTSGGSALAAPVSQAAQASQPASAAGIRGLKSAAGTGGATVRTTAHGFAITNARGDTLNVITDGTSLAAAIKSDLASQAASQAASVTPLITEECWTTDFQSQAFYHLLVRTETSCNINLAEVEMDFQSDYCPIGGWNENVNDCLGGWFYFSGDNIAGCLMVPAVYPGGTFCPSATGWASSSIAYPIGHNNHGTTYITDAAWFPDGSYDSGAWYAYNPQYFP